MVRGLPLTIYEGMSVTTIGISGAFMLLHEGIDLVESSFEIRTSLFQRALDLIAGRIVLKTGDRPHVILDRPVRVVLTQFVLNLVRVNVLNRSVASYQIEEV